MVLLEKWTPFRDLELLDRRLNWLFAPLPMGSGTAPAADVHESGEEVVVELDVPGYERDDLSVEVTDHTLAISGRRTSASEETARELRLHERLEATAGTVSSSPKG